MDERALNHNELTKALHLADANCTHVGMGIRGNGCLTRHATTAENMDPDVAQRLVVAARATPGWQRGLITDRDSEVLRGIVDGS